MIELPIKTIADIRSLGPCYDPVTGLDSNGKRENDGFLSEDWKGTALDILKVEACPAIDRLFVVLHQGWIDDRTLRLFAVWCARTAIERFWKDPDPRSVEACNVAERYAWGEATDEELAAARDAAWATAWAAAEAAARDAAWAAAEAAARDAAWAATEAAARDAAWAATRAAAWATAWAAAEDEQIKKLIEMLEA